MRAGSGRLVLGFGAHLGLSLFGAGYAKIATFPLVMLAFGYLPSIPKVHYIAQIARSRGIPHALPPQARTRW
jgi:hypothetical protein